MKLQIAGLLHDIGKFYQRTGEVLEDKYKVYLKDNAHYIHQAYTMQFIDKYLPKGLFDKDLLDLIGNHHNVDSLLSESNLIATGHDYKDKSDLISDENQNTLYKKQSSIFNEVSINNKKCLSNKQLKLTKLKDLEVENLSYNNDTSLKNKYQELFNEFIKELESSNVKKCQSLEELNNVLYPIMKEYTSTMPANTSSDEFLNISLFDHSKLTSAIGRCLEIKNNDYFIILEYDLSGIQNFIFKVTEGGESKSKIAKQLRSRSFYLSLLSDFIANYIIHEFDVSYENILFSSGGRGRILLPCIDDLDKVLKVINTKIEKFMFEEFQTLISISLSYYKVKKEELRFENFSELTNYENKIEVSSKVNKFATYLNNQENFILKPIDKCCMLCDKKKAVTQIDDMDVCDVCAKMLDLNDEILTKSKACIMEFVFDNNKNRNPGIIKSFNFGDLGCINIYFEKPLIFIEGNNYLSINCHYLGETKFYAIHDKAIDFGQMAEASEGDEKVAVIKMDVDNLGFVFYGGIKRTNQTISKSLTLSRMMDYFFSKKVKDICLSEKYENKYHENMIYINYSGGDDLCIVAPASMSLELTNDIVTAFKEYTGNNESITISAGIEIFKHKSPIRFAVKDAEENLEVSKDAKYIINNIEYLKNSTTVIGSTINNKDLKEVLDEIKDFKDAMNNNTLSVGGIYKIYTSILNCLESENVEEEFYRYIPNIAYSIKRNVTDKTYFEKLKNIFISAKVNVETLRKYKIILGYALMEIREKQIKNK